MPILNVFLKDHILCSIKQIEYGMGGNRVNVMQDLNLRKIRSFIVVAELKSFRRAADKLCISSSALSMQIRELEDFLGVPLLHRTTRSMQLTNEGLRFFTRSKAILADADALLRELHDTATLRSGRITIGCIPSLTASTLPAAMESFSKKYPGVSINILDDGSRRVESSIHSGEVDFAIGQAPAAGSDFDYTPLFEDDFAALVPASHPLAKHRQVRFAELAKHPFIGLRSSGSVRMALHKAMHESGVTLTPIFELTYHSSVARLVQAGVGIAAMPSTTISMYKMSGMVSVPIVAPRITREISILKKKGVRLSPPAQKFLEALQETVAKRNLHDCGQVQPSRTVA